MGKKVVLSDMGVHADADTITPAFAKCGHRF
jgi:hypothetical protein